MVSSLTPGHLICSTFGLSFVCAAVEGKKLFKYQNKQTKKPDIYLKLSWKESVESVGMENDICMSVTDNLQYKIDYECKHF